ncbi:MAG: DUF308 domain-containing protein [Phycisphaerales bacterium]|nr:DUF308 domain-containing protein [Phycisphaerales bacterium]
MDQASTTQRSDLRIDIRDALRRNRGLLWVEGFALLLGGIAAIIFPVAGGMALETLIAVIALVAGAATLVRCCTGGFEHVGSALATGVLSMALGAALLLWPIEGLEALVLILAAFCLIRGIADVIGSPARSKVAPVLQVISGVAGIVIAALLLIWFPTDALWAPGLLFGIELVFLSLPVLAVANAVSSTPAGAVETSSD